MPIACVSGCTELRLPYVMGATPARRSTGEASPVGFLESEDRLNLRPSAPAGCHLLQEVPNYSYSTIHEASHSHDKLTSALHQTICAFWQGNIYCTRTEVVCCAFPGPRPILKQLDTWNIDGNPLSTFCGSWTGLRHLEA